MRINVLFGGKAGQGIDKAASITADTLSKLGYYTFTYRDYGSLIRGGHNFDVLSISDKEINSHEKELDGILAMTPETTEKHRERLKKQGFKIDKKDIEDGEDLGKSLNMAYTGALAKKLGIDLDRLERKIDEEFQGEIARKNKEAAEKGYRSTETKINLKERNGEAKTITGSQAVSKGAIKSGMDIYLAYPMTPATPVLHTLAGKQEEKDILTFQPENELATVNAALGASHTGSRTMIGTSGGGYDLMQETMSMQGVSEIPLVLYLAQREGAGTGIPTYTAQGDLEIATKGSHSEFPRVTIAPGDPKEAMKATNQAFLFAEKYRSLAVILSDKHLAESKYTIQKEPEIKKIDRNIDKKKQEGLYENYEKTEDGNSSRSVPGINIVKSTSYEHNEKGITTEDPEKTTEMTDKRLRKQETMKKEAEKYTQYKIHGDKNTETTIVGWGSTKGAIKDALKDINAKFLQVIYLKPFPEEIKEILENSEKVILIENNSTGLLGKLIAEKTGYQIKEENKILKYDGRPFKSDELKNQIQEKVEK